jgi:hypothetical protein
MPQFTQIAVVTLSSSAAASGRALPSATAVRTALMIGVPGREDPPTIAACRCQNYARVVSELDESDGPTPKTWTTRHRIPMAIGTGLLTALCFWLLFTGDTTEKWIGGVGLAALVVWVFVFRTLYRRGY